MLPRLSLDLETYSEIDIKTSGLFKYVQAHSFQILLAGYSYDSGPVHQIDFTQGEQFPPEVVADFFSSGVLKKAFNATFEWYCLCKYFNVHDPISWLPQWHDTRIEALYCGFPSSLDAAGAAMRLPEDRKKLATGKALIKYFCKPCAPSKSNGGRTRNLPQHDAPKWELFKEYNKQDVVTESTIGDMLAQFPVPESEWALWRLDQAINFRGVCVDRKLIDGAQFCSAVTNEKLMAEARALAPVNNPKSVKQLADWINNETEETVTDLRKLTVSGLIDSTDDATLKRVLQIRQEVGKTSVTKYKAMENAQCDDGRVRGLLQFYGAQRTGRWAGRMVQVQNLPQNHIKTLGMAREFVRDQNVNMIRFTYGNIPDTLSQLIRTAFIPTPANIFTVADFSAIEARVIAWVTDETWRQQIFATHGHIYEASASAMFGVPIETIAKDENGNDLGNYGLRAKGKIAELALGYGGGVGAIKAMDSGHSLNEDDMPDLVRRWRKASPRIVDTWYALERAAVDTIRTGRINVVKCVSFAREIDRQQGQDFMTIQLPSGRKLYYDHPALMPGDRGERITYYGTHQKTHKWTTLETYGGKLIENVVQAIARDCLAICMQRLTAVGFKIVFHIHDEVIIDTPRDIPDPLAKALEIMAQPIPWAQGLILKGDGFTAEYYKKD